MLIPPFLNDNLPGGWFLTSSPSIPANWEADSDNRWTVPIGGGVGKVHRIGQGACLLAHRCPVPQPFLAGS
jgi:hypothetical protein